MLAASSYDDTAARGLPGLLKVGFGLKSQDEGLTALALKSRGGSFIKFEWADWPENVSQELGSRVDAFRQRFGCIRAVAEGSPEWNAIFRGRRCDPEAARAIAHIFEQDQYFPRRVRWVEAQKDLKGVISASLKVQSIGQIGLDLSWKDPTARVIDESLDSHESERLRRCFDDVFDWAGRRINTILEQLRDRLKTLYGDRFRGLYVFGSYARPDAGIELPESSDLDVALILSDFESPYNEIDRFGDITSHLSLEHDLVISLIPIREADYKEGRTNFTRVISEYSIRVE